MTALPTSVVSVERRDNVVFLSFSSAAPPPAAEEAETAWWPWTETADPAVSGKTSTATGPLPLRWSPRPLRVLADRYARSQVRADLAEWAGFVTFCAGVVVGLLFADYLHPDPAYLPGGTR